MTPRHHRKGLGFWLAAGLLFLMQAGVRGEGARLAAGPSQGALPRSDVVLVAANGPTGARGFSPESGTGGTSQDGGSRPAPVGDRNAPLDSGAASPAPQGGGGGGGGSAPRSNVVPVLRGNPDGVDAVSPEASPSPVPQGGGGGGGAADGGPFIRILPGGDAADWTRSPVPSTR